MFFLEDPLGKLASTKDFLLFVDGGPPVGSWLQHMGQKGRCQICQEDEEIPNHCLWSCTCTQAMWKGAMGILARAAPKLGPITWGTFCWCSTAMGHHLAFEQAPQHLVFLITQGTWAWMESFP